MAKKKTVRKKTVSKKRTKRDSLKARMIKAKRNFILFLVLSIISFVFYKASINELFVNFFGVLAIVFGFITLAFLIALIILWILGEGK